MVSTQLMAARLLHDFLTHSFVLSSLHFLIVSPLPHNFLSFPLPQLLGVSTPSRLPTPYGFPHNSLMVFLTTLMVSLTTLSWFPSQLSHGLFQGPPRGLPHNSLTDLPKDSLTASSQLP